MATPDDELLELLLWRWDAAEPRERVKEWRQIMREIVAHFRGREGRAAFLGAFISNARYDSDVERQDLWVIARNAMDDGETDEEEEEHSTASQIKEKRKAAKAEREATLRRLNKEFCVVNEHGRVWIFVDHYDHELEWHCWERMRQSDFTLMFYTEKICTMIKDDGKAVYQPLAVWWLSHPQRRTYAKGVIMKPGAEAREGVLNLWRGFGFTPKAGSWRRLHDHIRYVICGGDEYSWDYLMGWMARAVQFPQLPGEVALVMRGAPGAGKGVLGHALRKLFGNHGMHISQSDQLTGKFNVHLRQCLLLFADEAFFVGDKAGMRVLRALITERVKTIEVKGGAVYQAPNMLHVVMASNDEHVVPVITGERRMACFKVLDTFKGDYFYFKNITDELEAGGYAAMLDELLHYDLSTFEVRNIPETNVLEEQRKLSLSGVVAWWREVLERGYVYRSELGLGDKLHVWKSDVTTELLYASYCQYVQKRHERFEQRGTVLQYLTDTLGGHKLRVRNLIVGERMTRQGPEVETGSLPQAIRLGILPDARARFEQVTGIAIEEWPEPEAATDDVVVPLRASDDEAF